MAHHNSFGSWLRSRRKVLGMTQDELAQHVGCAAITIRKIESDERRPSLAVAEQLAASLDVPAHERDVFIKVAIGQAPIHLLIARARTNLPRVVTPLIGRDRVLAEGYALLAHDEVRLLTLLGPGGIGKTTLSLHLANSVEERYSDGVFFVDLADITDPTLVASVIAATIGVGITTPQLALAGLCESLRNQALLLILDNFEHLIAARSTVSALLKECFWLTIIVTSREPLMLRSEHQLRVEPLTLPPAVSTASIEEVAQSAAVALFIKRAQSVQPSMILSRDNAHIVSSICHLLDGIPLAIEMVAAQCALLSPSAILDRLGDRLALLRDMYADRPLRHQTVQATIAWSYERLSQPEQQLFLALTVFAGGWTLAAAEEVCGPDIGIAGSGSISTILVSLLMQLLTKNIIIRQTSEDGETRFGMLTLIRAFGLEQMNAHYAEQLHRRHARYYAAFVTQIRAVSDSSLLERSSVEYENIQTALHWALKQQELALIDHLAHGLQLFHQRTLAHLQYTRIANQQLEKLVAERTAALSSALASVELRERHLQEMNIALLKATEAAESANTMKTRFLQTISHELNTVLNTIIGFSQLIPRYGLLTDRQVHLLERIRQNSAQFAQMFTDISEIVVLENDTMDLQLELVDFVALINPLCKKYDLPVVYRIEDSLPLVAADRVRIEKTLLHILDVAQVWVSSGPIVVELLQRDEQLQIYIQFASIDIDRAEINTIFQPFLIASDITLSLSVATRIGLALGHKIVSLHKGQLQVECMPDKIILFSLTLPILA